MKIQCCFCIHKIKVSLMLSTLIHTLQLSFLFSDWFLVNTRSVLKMYNALRVLHPDCTRCFCFVIARVGLSHRLIHFLLGKIVNILHVQWYFKAISFMIFLKHEQMICFFFLSRMNQVNAYVSHVAPEMVQIQRTRADVNVRPMLSSSVRDLHIY